MENNLRRIVLGRFALGRIVRALAVLALVGGTILMPRQAAQSQTATIFVATNGSDSSGDGSEARPYKTITYAFSKARDGSLILVKPGTYVGEVQLKDRQFSQGVTIRSQVPYTAQLRNSGQVVASYSNLAKVTLEGFDISHTGPGAGALLINLNSLGTVGKVRDITIRDNVIHDSFNNDLMKISHGAQRIVVAGNVFYNQEGYDEHIDLNGALDSVIQDNIFFNDFEGSGRSNGNDTGAFIVIKDSDGSKTAPAGSQNITVRRNIFLNWQGHRAASFVLFGEDGWSYYEAQNILAENNLFLGNSPNPLLSPVGMQGARDVTFRNNTVVGNLPSSAFAIMARAVGDNPPNTNLRFYNNIWSDPTGSMNDFSDTPPGETSSFALSGNLYWNGGRGIPSESGDLINAGNDGRRVVADPGIRGLDGLAIPRWDAGSRRFGGGFGSIREAFTHIARTYGAARPDGPILNAGDGGSAPGDDLLARPREGAPDIGALESESYVAVSTSPSEDSVLITWRTGGALPAGTSWHITYDGISGDPSSPITGIPADQRSLRLGGLRKYQVFTVRVSAVADGKTVLSGTARAFATDLHFFIPSVRR